MFSLRQPRLVLVLILSACAPPASLAVPAQETKGRVASPASNVQKSVVTGQTKRRRSDAQAARGREEVLRRRRQREQAVADLSEVAADARSHEDAFWRARLQMLAADALWPADATSARAIFRRAWEAATVADREEQEESERDAGAGTTEHVTSTRGAVFQKVLRRDAKLAETFLRELLAADKEYEQRNALQGSTRTSSWREASAAASRRLSVAADLLRQDDDARAAAIVAPVVEEEGVSTTLIEFLLRLRERNAASADALFLRLLNRTLPRVEETDANAVLLLSSYVVSPSLLVNIDPNGTPMFRSIARTASDGSDASAHTPLAPPVRAAFYEAASIVLARRASLNATRAPSRETSALYFAVERLLPFFETDAPTLAPALRAQRDALAAQLGDARRDALLRQRDVQSLTPKNPTDSLRSLVDEVARERDASARERLRLVTVREAARRQLWERARSLAAEIEDAELRRTAQTIIAVKQIEHLSQAYAENDAEDSERAAAFVRNADVPPLARAWGFAQAAALAAQRERRERASELLDDAARFASITESGTLQRVAAYSALTRLAARIDKARAWESLSALVRAANSFEDLSGDEALVEMVASPPSMGLAVETDVFRFDEVFATMARLDFERARDAAKALVGHEPRALATIAAARVILDRDEKRDARSKTGERKQKP